jgi:hypothetical protein
MENRTPAAVKADFIAENDGRDKFIEFLIADSAFY